MSAQSPQLILASSSRFRRELLGRLGLPFESISPDVDESPLAGEQAPALAARLAAAKAAAIAHLHGDAVVIGSDQVGECEGHILGKPGSPEANVRQLLGVAGKTVTFYTGLHVQHGEDSDADVVPYEVRFRRLTAREATAYVQREPAHDCAGGFRSEALGIALFEHMRGDDPTALVGLPLIRLCRALRHFRLDPLGQAASLSSRDRE